MASTPVKEIVRQVKPLISTSQPEARGRVIKLYKAWFRALPKIVLQGNLPVSLPTAQAKLREEFMKNKNVKDIRVIDMLTFKGELHLKEIYKCWSQTSQTMNVFKESHVPRPKTFLSKFLAGQ